MQHDENEMRADKLVNPEKQMENHFPIFMVHTVVLDFTFISFLSAISLFPILHILNIVHFAHACFHLLFFTTRPFESHYGGL